MNLKAHLGLGLTFVVLILLGSIQGNRVTEILEAESFYRWILNASTQMNLGDSLIYDRSPDLPEPMDDVLFGAVADLAETSFSIDLEIHETEDYDDSGALNPFLVRAVRAEEDSLIWALASSDAAANLRKDFETYASSGKLQSLGTQFSTASLYNQSEDIQGLGVTNMFLGFRKLSANFLWLQVDNYWHAGELHRMLPLMYTCVTLDPNFIDAYLLGAWHMSYNIPAKLPPTPEAKKEFNNKYKKRLGLKEVWYYSATDFLKDGIRKNPRDYRLYFDLGYAVYENKLADHANAVRYLKEARRHRHERWVPRMLFHSLMLNGDYEESIEGWNEYLKMFPATDAAHALIATNKGRLAEVLYEEALECAYAAETAMKKYQRLAAEAESTGDLSSAENYREEASRANSVFQEMSITANAEKSKALTIWTNLHTEEEDPQAYSRILRMNALDYLDQGRYLEAVSELEAARWNYPVFFQEATKMMLDIKVEHNLLLDVSERREVERQKEDAKYLVDEKVYVRPRRITCEYIDTASENAA